jgi:hypothetical protein
MRECDEPAPGDAASGIPKSKVDNNNNGETRGLVLDIGIHTRVVSSRLGAVSIVVEDTAQDIKSIRDILPGLPSQITTIASQLDDISTNFTALTDKLGSMSLVITRGQYW